VSERNAWASAYVDQRRSDADIQSVASIESEKQAILRPSRRRRADECSCASHGHSPEVFVNTDTAIGRKPNRMSCLGDTVIRAITKITRHFRVSLDLTVCIRDRFEGRWIFLGEIQRKRKGAGDQKQRVVCVCGGKVWHQAHRLPSTPISHNLVFRKCST
jgi:hypothetical protein